MDKDMKASKEYDASLESGLLTDDNVLLTICNESVESQEILSDEDRTKVLSHRLMEKTKNQQPIEIKNESVFLNKTNVPVQLKNNCEVFLIKEYSFDQAASRNVPRPIAPKFPNNNCVNSGNSSFVFESYKKRDDKRRATHNEVERRRRDKINSWIFKLKELIPESAGASSPTDSRYKATTTDSKSQILIRACEYIKEMQDELKSLRECLNENDRLRLSNQQLQLQMNQLKSFISQPKDHVCETPTEKQRTYKQ